MPINTYLHVNAHFFQPKIKQINTSGGLMASSFTNFLLKRNLFGKQSHKSSILSVHSWLKIPDEVN